MSGTDMLMVMVMVVMVVVVVVVVVGFWLEFVLWWCSWRQYCAGNCTLVVVRK
jgi:hypothetical protein